MQHSDVGGDRLQRLFEIRPVLAKYRVRQPDRRRVNGHALHLPFPMILVAPIPSRTSLACASLVGR
jgi:hypothetical protein